MSEQRLSVRIEKRLRNFKLDVYLEVGREILVLFGPSGAGKTQTLNAIAGLTTPDEGEIALDGETFFRSTPGHTPVNIPARKRGVGYVFQHYALFPHLTALENVGYSIWRERDGVDHAMRWLERMQLRHLATRYPHELSGGQQQRVAIARALAAGPKVLLLDEPFSALDTPLRGQLHDELTRLQIESHLIVIYVTHNLDDALAVGHRMAVIKEGRIEQVGMIEEVIERPASRTALEILGIPNSFEARVIEAREDGVTLDWDGLILKAAPQRIGSGDRVYAYILPEEIMIAEATTHTSEDGHNLVNGKIVRSQPGRNFNLLRVRLPNEHEIEVSVYPYHVSKSSRQIGSDIQLLLPQDRLRILLE